jgi:hypothetical protein
MKFKSLFLATALVGGLVAATQGANAQTAAGCALQVKSSANNIKELFAYTTDARITAACQAGQNKSAIALRDLSNAYLESLAPGKYPRKNYKKQNCINHLGSIAQNLGIVTKNNDAEYEKYCNESQKREAKALRNWRDV